MLVDGQDLHYRCRRFVKVPELLRVLLEHHVLASDDLAAMVARCVEQGRDESLWLILSKNYAPVPIEIICDVNETLYEKAAAAGFRDVFYEAVKYNRPVPTYDRPTLQERHVQNHYVGYRAAYHRLLHNGSRQTIYDWHRVHGRDCTYDALMDFKIKYRCA